MRSTLFIILLLVSLLSFAQEAQPKISIAFQDVPLKEVIVQLETKTSLEFYFIEDWFAGYRFTGAFEDASLEEILEEIFKETLLNFYSMDGNKIILTRNNVIYDQFPSEIFKNPAESTVEINETQPVFIAAEQRQSNVRTVYIGKEDKSNKTRNFLLSGYAVEAESNRPLPNLTVMIRDRNIGTVTNDQGYYELLVPIGSHLLETSSLDTRPVQVRVVIYNNGELNLQLEENFEQLGEILLAAKSNQNVRQAITGLEQINVNEIKTIPLVLGERDILKVATTLPGISTAGEGAAGFNVRGGRADQNLILLDDAVLYNPAHFFGIFSALNPFTSGEVNIYKGSIPAEYGGRLSSVFDIKTRKANAEKFAGEASIGPVTSSLALEIPVVKEKSALLLGGRSTYSDWILQNLDEPSLKNTRASFYDIIAKYHHIINENHDVEVTGYFSKDVFSITSDSLFSYDNRLGSLRYNHRFNSKNRGSLIVSNSNYNFNIDYQGGNANDFKSGYRISETEVKYNLNYLYSDKHDFNYGVSSKLYVVKPGRIEPLGEESLVEPLNISSEKGLESALYVADNFKINERLLITAGLRFSLYNSLGPGIQNTYEQGIPRSEFTITEVEEFGSNEVMHTYAGPELRLSARYFLAPELSLKGSYNTTYQYIHTLSNNTTVSPTDTYKLSDNNIKPQSALQYTLGLYKNFGNDMYETSVEGYYRESKDILDFKVGAQLFLNENIETEVLQGEGQAYGVEFLIRKSLGNLNGWIGYSYSRSLLKLDSEFRDERVNNGEFFPANFDKPHDFSFVGNYKLTKRFSLSANFVYQTGRPVTFPIGKYTFNGADYVFYSDRNKFRIPDYYRLDVSFNVEGNHRIKKFAHSFWNVSVYNVLGRNNPYSVFFVTENGEVKAYQSSIFSIPIPTITYNFRF